MVNKIWGFFIIVGTLFALCNGKIDVINEEILTSCKSALDLVIQLFPVLALWLGVMKIASSSGLLEKISYKISPVLRFIFPEIPAGHPALGYISSNIIANIFGLGNAATPFGLKAMESLQTLNPKKDEASRSMITFLVLNTSGLTLIPTTIISMRMLYKSVSPTEIIVPCILATTISTIVGLLLDRILHYRSKHV